MKYEIEFIGPDSTDYLYLRTRDTVEGILELAERQKNKATKVIIRKNRTTLFSDHPDKLIELCHSLINQKCEL